jgi:BirA family transcriptional regulator, biotin operon repressor / biotin---[acetyl-CoA-carboxylase] ligase
MGLWDHNNHAAPRLYHFERVASTMDVIHELAAEGAAAGTVVIAGEQLEGRGSRGRSWHSPPGGLWMSVLYRPSAPDGVEVVSLRVGLALAEAVEPVISRSLQLKWPNDLMLGERKVGGILCEARWQGDMLAWVAVGIGMNVRNHVASELDDVATSLAQEHIDTTTDRLVEPIVATLRRVDLGPERLSRAEVDRFARRDWLSGREIRSPMSGMVIGLREDGALLVRTAQGSDTFLRSGSVELAAVSPSR